LLYNMIARSLAVVWILVITSCNSSLLTLRFRVCWKI
jgi:hypothetical protein